MSKVLEVVAAHDGDLVAAAKALGVRRDALYTRLRRNGQLPGDEEPVALKDDPEILQAAKDMLAEGCTLRETVAVFKDCGIGLRTIKRLQEEARG